MQRYFGSIQDANGNAIPNASVTVYNTGIANPVASIYAASGSALAPAGQANPMVTDALGNFGFAAPDGRYDIVISGGGIPTITLPNLCLFDNTVTYPSPQLGTVTSVSLAAPAIFTVSGSPVTGVGTLTLTLASQNQNLLLASPDGLAGTPAFRAMVGNDLPNAGSAGTYGSASQVPVITTDAKGRVTGVANTTIAAPWGSITGLPTTLSGYGITDGASINVANSWTKAQNVASVALSIAAGNVAVDASLSNVFYLACISNFTLVNPTNAVSGATITINFKQDATGSRLITFGTAYKFPGGVVPTLSTAANAKDTLYAVYDHVDSIWRCSLIKNYF